MVNMAIVSFTNYKRGQTKGGMGAVMRYTAQDWKTKHDGRQLVTGINCQPETAYSDFMTTKYLHHKTEGVLFYHMVQSFPKGADVNPVVAHAAAQKLAEYFAGHEVLVCTHKERDHIHSHFIINSVSFDTGKKLHIAKEQLQELRQRNDEVCMQFSLPVFEPKPDRQKSKRMTMGEYHTAARGQSKKLQLMNIINDCMRYASNREEFIALMESEGCKVRWEKSRQNITYTTPSGWQCRDCKLFGDKYLKERMEREFEIRTGLIYGRAHAEESLSTYEEGRSATVYTGTGNNSGSDTTVHTAANRDPVCNAGGTESIGQTPVQSGTENFTAGNIASESFGEMQSSGDTISDGRAAESSEAPGADGRTGWEEEREAFFSSEVQTAQTAPVASGMGLADSGHDHDGAGDAVHSVVSWLRRLEQNYDTVPIMDATTTHHRSDSKALRKEHEKKVALGHNEKDHEDERTYTWQQTM